MGLALRHVGVVVSDLNKALNIFVNCFGCEVVNIYPQISGTYISELVGMGQVRMKIAILKTLDNNRIELIEYESHPGRKRAPVMANDIGVSHFAISVRNIRTLYDNRSQFNIQFLSPPLLSPNGFVEVAYTIIMDEFMIELVQVLDERAVYTN
jgi:hypothetical protein